MQIPSKHFACLQDLFKICLQEDVLKTYSRQTNYLPRITVSSKSKSACSKSIFHKSLSDESKVNPKYIN